jgi:hypothetical protein
MSKLELSINVNYLPAWKAWEGIRELIQNGKDAETEFNAPLVVTHHNNTLRIENEGAVLTRDALLFGTTSKTDRTDMIGKFGEGLKLGVLALVRSGREVKIRTGGEVWTASIERSKQYQADTLHFDCKGGNEDKQRVRVEISNVSETDWEGLRDRFLFLTKTRKNEIVETKRGSLLLGERFKGKIYVKGIYVQEDPQLQAGYDFMHADIDRDRRMIGDYDRRYESGAIWNLAVAQRPDLFNTFFEHVEKNAPDVAGVGNTATYYLPEELQKKFAAKFQKQFGKNAMPVETLAESAEVEHLGKRGVVVSKPLSAILETVLGNRATLARELREAVTKTWSWNELTATQQKNLLDAVHLVQAARAEATDLFDLVDIVDFRSESLLGQFKDARILIASRILNDRDETLATLVHEFSHRNGGDGEKGHVAAIENLWRDIVKTMRNDMAARS